MRILNSGNDRLQRRGRFLDSGWRSEKNVGLSKVREDYSQGDPASGVEYIQEGTVKLTVVNEVGIRGSRGILARATSLGGCLAGQTICMATATAIHPRLCYS